VCVNAPRYEAAREARAGYHNHVLIPHWGESPVLVIDPFSDEGYWDL
jgi:hypothetical protein